MIYDIAKLKTIEPKRLLRVFTGSSDWDADSQAPSECPYFGELTLYYDKFMVSSQVIVYPIFDGEQEFVAWDISTMTIDNDANAEIVFNESVPNSLPNEFEYSITASFLGDNIIAYSNTDEIVGELCRLFNNEFNSRLSWSEIDIDYPDGFPIE